MGSISWMLKEVHLSLSASVAISLWHRYLGHTAQLKEIKGLVNGVDLSTKKEVSLCEGCLKGKLSKNQVDWRNYMRMMQLNHSDICGPMQTESINGTKYFVTFTDDYSRCYKVYFLKQNHTDESSWKGMQEAAD